MLIFLVFHKIQEHSGGDIHAISPNNFLKQLLMIQRGGLPILDPNILSDPKSYYRDGIIFTFDDGTSDHYQIVRPLLNEYGIRGIFYVSTARLDRDRYITQQQVRSLWEDGHVIGSHSHSHKRMDLMSSREVKNELKLSADIIHNIIGLDPVHFAPPGGFYNRNVQETARSLGYSSCRTMDWGYNRSFDPMCIEV